MFDNKIFDNSGGGGGGALTPAGSDTQIQFNDGGSFAGASGLLYDKTNIGLTLSRVADDALGPAFVMQQSRGAAGEDNDVIGTLAFNGYNDAVAPELVTFAEIKSSILDASDGSEDGCLDFSVMCQGVWRRAMRITKDTNNFYGVSIGDPDVPLAALHVDSTSLDFVYAAKIVNTIVNRGALYVEGPSSGYGINAFGGTAIVGNAASHGGVGINATVQTNYDGHAFIATRNAGQTLGVIGDYPVAVIQCADPMGATSSVLRIITDCYAIGRVPAGFLIDVLNYQTPYYRLTGLNVVNHYNNGTAPTAVVADASQAWCADLVAGDARLSIMGEKNTNTLTLGAGNVLLRPDTMADDSVSGETFVGTAGEDLAWGDVVYMAADGKFYKADADSSSTAPAVAFCTATISADASGEFLKRGWIRDDSAYNFTKGPGASGLIYLSTDAGAVTQTAPSGTGDQVQVLGWAYTADIWYFEPQLVMVEV